VAAVFGGLGAFKPPGGIYSFAFGRRLHQNAVIAARGENQSLVPAYGK
jgi:hypothetical protein